jgi:hypothetical protein
VRERSADAVLEIVAAVEKLPDPEEGERSARGVWVIGGGGRDVPGGEGGERAELHDV